MSQGKTAAGSRFLRRKEAARYIRETYHLPLSYNTLAKFAVTGDGPAFRRFGRYPIYAEEDLDAWIAMRLSPAVFSTSEFLGSEAPYRVGADKIKTRYKEDVST